MIDLNKHDVLFYLITEGCYVVSDEFNQIVLAFRCNTDKDVNKIDLDGKDLHIKWLQGDISELIGIADGIRNFVFEREHDPENYRIYSYNRVKSIIKRTQEK